MGGKAFLRSLPHHTFPRIPTASYTPIKSHLLSRLTPHFKNITVPHECPEKHDHGDIDFVVSDLVDPNANTTTSADSSTGESSSMARWRHNIPKAIGAEHIQSNLGKKGFGTCQFAVPLSALESIVGERTVDPGHVRVDIGLGNSEVQETRTGDAQDGRYFQVDMVVCKDKDEYDRYAFYNSYGDLGFIITRLSNCAGLSFSPKGLSIALPDLVPTYSPTLLLSTSIPSILSYLDLDLPRWHSGFSTQSSAFEWVASSKFYDPHRIAVRESRLGPKGLARAQEKANSSKPSKNAQLSREMYQNWVKWNEDLKGTTKAKSMAKTRRSSKGVFDGGAEELGAGVWEVLEMFGKRDIYEEMAMENMEKVQRIEERLEKMAGRR